MDLPEIWFFSVDAVEIRKSLQAEETYCAPNRWAHKTLQTKSSSGWLMSFSNKCCIAYMLPESTVAIFIQWRSIFFLNISISHPVPHATVWFCARTCFAIPDTDIHPTCSLLKKYFHLRWIFLQRDAPWKVWPQTRLMREYAFDDAVCFVCAFWIPANISGNFLLMSNRSPRSFRQTWLPVAVTLFTDAKS